MISRLHERLGGLFMATASATITAWNWYLAIYDGYCYLKIATLGPPLTIIGLGLFLFPDYCKERIQRGENIDKLSGIELITRRWWTILVVAMASTIVNLQILESWRSPL
jgi:hypothetical protein